MEKILNIDDNPISKDIEQAKQDALSESESGAKAKSKATAKDLFYKKRNYFEIASEEEKKAMFDYAEGYKTFLDAGKTERESFSITKKLVEAKGFSEYKFGDKLSVGDKKYFNNRGKSIVLFKIGTKNLEDDGIRIVASHIDAPRIDLKQVPLYEDTNMCFLKTHYYGGIKKYQWTAIPLALHGSVILLDGRKVDIRIGEDEGDPLFCITDLLPHLGKEQMGQPVSKLIEAEQLNVVIGGIPAADSDCKDKVKANILKILNEKYGMCEEDFLSSELCVVPAFKASDVGIDRSLIGAYGHDDRVCAYPALTALLDTQTEHTIMTMLVDKEEIGSEGTTGMQCAVYEDLMEDISSAFGANFRKVRAASRCISADVTSCYDPSFSSVYEKNNAAIISCGTCMNKFTGAGGKSSSSDASAEFVGEVRTAFAKENVVWQMAELGKVDIGGGGTIAKFIAKLNIDTVDVGVPVLSMHAPFELISKADLYSNYKAFCAFFKYNR